MVERHEFLVIDLAFPYHEYPPTDTLQLAYNLFVTLNIGFKFFLPKLRIACGPRCITAALVSMPETTVNE